MDCCRRAAEMHHHHHYHHRRKKRGRKSRAEDSKRSSFVGRSVESWRSPPNPHATEATPLHLATHAAATALYQNNCDSSFLQFCYQQFTAQHRLICDIELSSGDPFEWFSRSGLRDASTMSKAMKPPPAHRDVNRGVWWPKSEDVVRGRDRQERSVSRERRRSPPPLSAQRRRQGGDRESYKSPIREREFEKPPPPSRRRSRERGRSRSVESRRSTRYGTLSPPRPSRNGRHGDAPDSRHSISHRHKRRHSSRSPSRRKKSRSPGHSSHKKKTRRPRSRSRSDVRRARKDNSLSPRPRSPPPKKYSGRAPSARPADRRDRSTSYSPRRSPLRSYRQRSPRPRGRPPQPLTRRPSPPPLSPRYAAPSSRKQSPPPQVRDRRNFRRRSRSRSPHRGPGSPPPFRRIRSPQRSPPHISKHSSMHHSPPPRSPRCRRRSVTPPVFDRVVPSKLSPRSDRRAGEHDDYKYIIDSNLTDVSSEKMGTSPPRRVVPIPDHAPDVSRNNPMDSDSRQTTPHDSYGEKQQERGDTDAVSHSLQPDSKPSGPYVNPDRQRNIIVGDDGHGKKRARDLNPKTQPDHDNYSQPSFARRGSHSSGSYHESQYHGSSHQQGPLPHYQSGYRGRGRGFRGGRYSPQPLDQRPSYERRGSERGRGYRGRGGSGYDHADPNRSTGRHRSRDPHDQHPSSFEHSRQPKHQSPDDNHHRTGAEPRAKDELEEDRKDSGSEMSLGDSSQTSAQPGEKQGGEMPPPTWPAPKSPEPLDGRAFKRITEDSNAVRNSASVQEEKASNGFRPFSISISLGKSKVGHKTALLPKALDASRETNREVTREVTREANREVGREFSREFSRETGRQTNRETNRETSRDTARESRRECYRAPSSYPASGTNSAPLGKNARTLKLKRDSPVVKDSPDTSKPQIETANPPPVAKPVLIAKESSIYNRLSMVGEGTYGKVYKASNNITKELVALKRIRMESEKDGFPITAVREMRLLQALKQDNVICLLEMMVEKSDFYMVFEYMDHDLTGILNHPTFRLEPCHIKHLAKQFFEGLEYLHHRGVLHRDIKGSNILLNNDGQLKIADFGLARFYTKASKKQLDYTNRIITLWYRPPEILLGATAYGPAVDIWSAACVFVELFTRQPVFTGKTEIDQLDIIYNVMGTPTEKVWAGLKETPWYGLLKTPGRRRPKFHAKYEPLLPPSALELVMQMLEYDPDKRPSAEECLKHQYFTEEPAPAPPLGLRDLKGDWHEYESKMERRKERDINEKKKRAQYELDKRKWKENREAEKKKLAQQEYDPERPPVSTSPPNTATSSIPTKRKRESLEAEDIESGISSASKKRVE